MTSTDKDLQQLKDLIIMGNAETQKQIAELTLNTQKQISGLAQEMRLEFAHADTKMAELKAITDIGFAELGGKIDVLDERTKIGFWGFIGLAVIITPTPTLKNPCNLANPATP